MQKSAQTALLSIALVMSAGVATAREAMNVLSTSGCGCCVGWVRQLEAFDIRSSVQHLPAGEFWQRKVELGLREGLTSCHTGLIGGYVIEGHVPAREITKLLTDLPDAIGLVVPGMPMGSPGMGEGQSDVEPYRVLLLKKDGSTEVYAAYE